VVEIFPSYISPAKNSTVAINFEWGTAIRAEGLSGLPSGPPGTALRTRASGNASGVNREIF